jgi:hypothetical protein
MKIVDLGLNAISMTVEREASAEREAGRGTFSLG